MVEEHFLVNLWNPHSYSRHGWAYTTEPVTFDDYHIRLGGRANYVLREVRSLAELHTIQCYRAQFNRDGTQFPDRYSSVGSAFISADSKNVTARMMECCFVPKRIRT